MPHYGALYRNYWKMQEPKPLIQEGRKAMTKQDIWLRKMKKKHKTLHSNKGERKEKNMGEWLNERVGRQAMAQTSARNDGYSELTRMYKRYQRPA
jgi:hypothetical protein